MICDACDFERSKAHVHSQAPPHGNERGLVHACLYMTYPLIMYAYTVCIVLSGARTSFTYMFTYIIMLTLNPLYMSVCTNLH